MESFVTGATIKQLREEKNITQSQLADIIGVSDKTISKWETGKGLPDISLIEPLAAALGISVAELFAGEWIVNQNKHANMRRMKFYVCPICGNVIWSTGEMVVNCCGISLPVLEAETLQKEDITDHAKNTNFHTPICANTKLPEFEENMAISRLMHEHQIIVERIEDEYYVRMHHDMTKTHYISFIAYVTSDACSVKKLYPEGNAEGRFLLKGHGDIYVYCNKHGLYKMKV